MLSLRGIPTLNSSFANPVHMNTAACLEWHRTVGTTLCVVKRLVICKVYMRSRVGTTSLSENLGPLKVVAILIDFKLRRGPVENRGLDFQRKAQPIKSDDQELPLKRPF